MTTVDAKLFDEVIDRRGTHSMKWDGMESRYGVSPDEGISMWVADMDFRPPDCVSQAIAAMADPGVYGYFADDAAYKGAICWWMKNRHGWSVDPATIFTTHGLVNAVGLCVETYTAPGDGIILTTPVYHAFARVIEAADRRVVEMPLALDDGAYGMDFDHWDGLVPSDAKMMILCSPHNPGGRVWTRDELEGVAAFCRRHDLILISDEIHHDLLMPGESHTPMALIDGIEDRLIMLTAASKTFNIAGCHTGNVIIADGDLRARFAKRMMGLGIGPNSFGLHMIAAAYSAEGALWLDTLRGYLQENARVFDAGIAAIPGLKSMPLQSTYLAWVDFEGTGMTREEFTARVENDAKIAANHGPTFGLGGESYLRFNIATPRSVVEDAVARLARAFADLQ